MSVSVCAVTHSAEESTRRRLIRVARDRFAAEGYAATSLDAVAVAAGVTKGSLYHHFAGKADLFTAVFADEQAALTRVVAEAYGAESDPWEAARAGMRVFLDAHMDPGVRRITLVDAPSALGWHAVRKLDAPYGFALMRAALEALAATGRLRHQEIDALAHLLFGALCEAAMSIADADDPQAARRAMQRELEALLETIAPRG